MPRAKSQLNQVMTFGEHLEALRWHLVRAIVGLAICFVGCIVFGRFLLEFLLAPLRRALAVHEAGQIVADGPMAGLIAYFQISMVGGLLLASPWVIYQLWGFVAPGLYPREKRLVYRSVPLFVWMFVAGALFGWFVALPSSLDFMIRFNLGAGLQHQIAVSRWATFALVFPIAFGVSFELPLAMVVTSKIGLVSGMGFRKHRKVALLICAIASAALTPSPNPLDMILMLVPLALLYEGGVCLVRLSERRVVETHATTERDESDNLFANFLLPLLTVRMYGRANPAR